MTTITIATVIGTGLATAILGLAAPAQAVAPGDGAPALPTADGSKVGIDHLSWLEDIRPKVKVAKP